MSKMFDRRSFLRFTGKLAPVAAVASAPVAAAASPLVVEDARLLELGKIIDAGEVAFRVANAEFERVNCLFKEAVAAIPEELIRTAEESRYLGGERAKDLNFDDVPIKGLSYRSIFTVATLTKDMVIWSGRTKIGKSLRKKLPIAKQYEASLAALRTELNADEIRSRHEMLMYQLQAPVIEANELTARTLAGVKIKSRAIALILNFPNKRGWWAHQLAGDLAQALATIDLSGGNIAITVKEA